MAEYDRNKEEPDDYDEEDLTSKEYDVDPVDLDILDPEARFPREVDASYDPDDDLSDDEIDRIIGKSSGRRKRIFFVLILVLGSLSLWIFRGGGRERITGWLQKATTAVVNAPDSLMKTDSLTAPVDSHLVSLAGMDTIPAGLLPQDLLPDTAVVESSALEFAAIDSVKPDSGNASLVLADSGFAFEDEPTYPEEVPGGTLFPTLASLLGKLSENELVDSLPGSSVSEFEWMLHVDLGKEEILDTLPDMSDDDFYRMLTGAIPDSDTIVIASEDDLNRMLIQSLEEIPFEHAMLETTATAPAQVTKVVVHDTVVVVDSRLKSANDSLKTILRNLQKALDVAHTDLSGLKLEVKTRDTRLATKRDSARSAEVGKFARIIEKMEPGEAVKRLEGRTVDELVELLFLLNQRDAARIIAAMPPQKGQEVATRIFNR